MKSSGRSGFSLVEVLVALAIVAVGMVSILGLQHQLVLGQHRYESALAKADLERSALVLLQAVNPMATPTGEKQLPPNVTVQWVGEPLGVARRNAGLPSGDGNFLVQLYRLKVIVTDRAAARSQAFTVEQLGWQALESRPVDGP
jgi:prepilin-type N-terminal cleavage/methylation domain-containing protein